MMKKKGWAAAGVIAFISLLVLLSAFFSGRSEQPVPDDETARHLADGQTDQQASDGKPDGTNAEYDLELQMKEDGTFQVSAVIGVANDSADTWNEIGFYLVPNAMNALDTQFYRDDHAEVEISALQVDGETADYTLDNNELMVALETELERGAVVEISIDYSLELPKEGMRLSQVEDNFYLAQWYPMLAVYDDGWNIEDYDSKGESYDTAYGNFIVSYQLPADYLVASSAEDGVIEAVSSGKLEGDNYKDFYIAFMDSEEWETAAAQAGDTNLRVFAPKGTGVLEETTALASDAYRYFEQHIGDNPFGELDIIANDGYMEYPNIIEVATEEEALDAILVHEIAHQWFYFLVANDPFKEAWLDESLAEFTTALFLSDRHGDADSGFQYAVSIQASYPPETYLNFPLDEFDEAKYYSTIYGKGPLLLKEFFDGRGGREAALEFLSAYYTGFQFKRVDSEAFKVFFEDYFEGDQSEFLDSWLK